MNISSARIGLVLVLVSVFLVAGCGGDDDDPVSPAGGDEDVRADGSGRYATIQEAIQSAAPGDTIRLADGIFTGDGNRNIGFLGKEITVMSSSGDPEKCIIDCQAAPDSVHRAFIFQSGEGPTSVLQGIGIRNGNVLKQDIPVGGGLLCENSSGPLLINLVFIGNEAGAGGAVGCLEGSSPTMTGCSFKDNSGAFQAGAVYCSDGSAPVITMSEFIDNYAYDMGGAIYARKSSAVEITDSVFEGNISRYGGAITCMFESSVDATRVRFTENSSWSSSGGAIYGSFECPMNMTSCLFEGNYAPERGGAVACGGTSRLEDCVFVENSSGGIGGAAYLHEFPTVVNCTFRGNTTGNDGGVIYCEYDSEVTIENCIIADGTGGAMNCTYSNAPTISCTNIFGNPGGDWEGKISDLLGVDGNISADPLFCAEEPGDSGYWTIGIDSPSAPANSSCGGMGSGEPGCMDNPG